MRNAIAPQTIRQQYVIRAYLRVEGLQEQLGRDLVSNALFLRPLIGKQCRDVLHPKAAAGTGANSPKQRDVVVADATLGTALDDFPEEAQLDIPFLAPAAKPLLVAREAAGLRVPLRRRLARARGDRCRPLVGEVVQFA